MRRLKIFTGETTLLRNYRFRLAHRMGMVYKTSWKKIPFPDGKRGGAYSSIAPHPGVDGRMDQRVLKIRG